MSNRDFFPRFYDSEGKVMLYWQCYMQSAFNRLTDTQHFGLLYKLLKNPGIIMMRCTGLRDKNGKLIYESDIVKSTLYTINMKVVYCVEESFFGLKYPHNDDNRCSAAMPSSEEIEIIGNIHENPELLEAS